MVTINQVLDQDTAILVVEEMGHTGQRSAEVDPESVLYAEEVQILSPIYISEPTRPLYITYAVFCLQKKLLHYHLQTLDL